MSKCENYHLSISQKTARCVNGSYRKAALQNRIGPRTAGLGRSLDFAKVAICAKLPSYQIAALVTLADSRRSRKVLKYQPHLAKPTLLSIAGFQYLQTPAVMVTTSGMVLRLGKNDAIRLRLVALTADFDLLVMCEGDNEN